MSQLKLTDVAKINMGQSPSSETYNSEKNGLPFYQGNVDFGEKYPTVRIWCDKPTKIAEPGDILMSVRAPIGALNYANEKCCIGRGLAAITPDPDMTSSEFIYWFLRARHSELNRIGTGSTFKAINRKTLESIEFPKYNKNEQYYIAEILSKIDKTIGEKKAQLEKLDNLIKARFVEMFGDEDPVFVFDDVLIDDTKNGFKLDSSNYSNLGKIAIVDQGQKRICGYINAVDGKAPWSKEAIIFGDHTEMFKYINFPFYLGADGTKLLSPKNGWNTRFLYHYLDINYHKRLGYMRHFKYLKEMSFIQPDLDRQEEFCMFCTQVDKSKFTLSNELAMGNFYIRLIHDCIMHGCIDLRVPQ